MANNSKGTRGLRAVRKRFMSRVERWVPLIILAAFSICLVLFFPYDETMQKFDLPKVGTASTETVIAPFTFDIVRTPEELERERRRAIDQVLLVMDYDTMAAPESARRLARLWDAVRAISAGEPDSVNEPHRKILERELSERAVATLLRRPDLFHEISGQLTRLMERGVSATLLYAAPDELNEQRRRFSANFESNQLYTKRHVTLRRGGSETEIAVAVDDILVREAALERVTSQLRRDLRMDDEGLNTIYEVLHVCVRPNIRVNERVTAERRNAAVAEVRETSGKVIKDTEIVRRHQEVTPEIVQKLLSLHMAMDRIEGDAEQRRVNAGYAGRIILLLILLFFLSFYMKKYKPNLVKSPKKLLALSIIVLLQILIIGFGVSYFPLLFEAWEVSAAVPEYLIPTTAAALLCTILFGMQISMLVSLFVSIYFGIVTGFNHYFFL